MVRAVRPAKSYFGSRALPAAAISRLLSDRGESVPTFVMTGLPMSLLGLRYYSVFKASKPRPLGGAVPVANPLGAKQNPLTRVGRRYLPNVLGGYPVAASIFNSLPVISQRSIPPTPGVSIPFSFGSVRGTPSAFKPTHAPRLSAGLAPYVEVCFPTAPGLSGAAPGCRQAKIIAPLREASSGQRKNR